MVFSSGVFLFLFLPITILIYYNPIICSRMFRNIWLLFVSILFYAWGEPIFVFIMLGSVILNWYAGIVIEKLNANLRRRKVVLYVIVGYDISLFFIFKYLTFVLENINLFFSKEISIPDIALPIGISFFLFQLLSYIFDVYYKKVMAAKQFIPVALYVTMFPQLIAGPIVRYQTINSEIVEREESIKEVVNGIRCFTVGLGKKVLLADYLAVVADNIFTASELGADCPKTR